MAVKWHRARGEINLSSKKEDENSIRNDIDANYVNDKYLLQI